MRNGVLVDKQREEEDTGYGAAVYERGAVSRCCQPRSIFENSLSRPSSTGTELERHCSGKSATDDEEQCEKDNQDQGENEIPIIDDVVR